jgi:hypothetical protein
MFVASAPMIEPMKNIMMARRRIGFRPKISLNLANGGVAAGYV